MVALGPIGFIAGCRREIGRGFPGAVLMLVVELSTPPLQASAFEEAQRCAGKGAEADALVVCQAVNVESPRLQTRAKFSHSDECGDG